ncbi:MAG: hypothetical protein IH942_07365 [Acidobacteria bacterium]|nr:hypothetical protein [Acidobacteriota bacterium]
MAVRLIDGNNILYHYLQKDLQDRDPELFGALVADLIASLGIWLPQDAYQRMPLLLPWAVRDPDSRGNKRRGIEDQWGSPNDEGRFRDDNSLIKGLPKRLAIVPGLVSEYRNARMGNGFVAAHIWRIRADGELATRRWDTYSFVPNIMWLPAQVAKLTDREGAYAQRYLQALSLKLYRDAPITDDLRPFVEAPWSLLPDPGIPEADLPDLSDLSFFECDDTFFASRKRAIGDVLGALQSLERGDILNKKLISSRYGDGLPSVSAGRRSALMGELASYLAALG